MTMRKLQMVDLGAQYLNIKKEIDQSIQSVVDSCAFINGPEVKNFQTELEVYFDVKNVIDCGNLHNYDRGLTTLRLVNSDTIGQLR